MQKESIFNDLIKRNIVTVSENRLKFFNVMDIAMYDSSGWVINLQRLGEDFGSKYLFELGYLMGKDSAEEFFGTIIKMKAYIPKDFFMTERAIEITGFGVISLDKSKKKIEVRVEHNHIIAMSREKYGRKAWVCNFYAGVYSGFLEIFEKKRIKLKSSSCICKGKKQCIFSN